jgi:hypothetical protein
MNRIAVMVNAEINDLMRHAKDLLEFCLPLFQCLLGLGIALWVVRAVVAVIISAGHETDHEKAKNDDLFTAADGTVITIVEEKRKRKGGTHESHD